MKYDQGTLNKVLGEARKIASSNTPMKDDLRIRKDGSGVFAIEVSEIPERRELEQSTGAALDRDSYVSALLGQIADKAESRDDLTTKFGGDVLDINGVPITVNWESEAREESFYQPGDQMVLDMENPYTHLTLKEEQQYLRNDVVKQVGSMMKEEGFSVHISANGSDGSHVVVTPDTDQVSDLEEILSDQCMTGQASRVPVFHDKMRNLGYTISRESENVYDVRDGNVEATVAYVDLDLKGRSPGFAYDTVF